MGLFILMLRQSAQGRGIWMLLLALMLAVMATTALRFTSETLTVAIDQQAGQMLAADLALTDNQPIAPQWQQRAKQLQLRTSQVLLFSSMAQSQTSAGDQFVLVNVKAIEAGFPLRGALSLQPQLNIQVPQPHTIWLSPALFDVLKVNIGDSIRIADASFTVKAAITRDPNQETGMSGFSPTVIINAADVAATHAIQVGSRIDYRLLLAGEPQQLAIFKQRYAAQIKQQSSSDLRLRDASSGNSRLLRPVQSLQDYAQIASILTLLLCGVAIALACQRFVAEQLDQLALLRCLGASQKQLIAVYAGLLLLLLGVAIVIGMVLGAGVAYALLKVLHATLPALELVFNPVIMLAKPLMVALLTALVLLIGFAVPDLFRLVSVAPLRVIRQVDESLKWLRIFSATLAIAVLFTFLLIQTGKLGLSLSLLAGIALALVVMYAAAILILKLLQRLTISQAYIRQPTQMSVQIVALALGLGLLSTLIFLRQDLMQRWQQSLPVGTPNQFVYGLPPDQKTSFANRIAQQHWQATPLYPNIKGRLIAKNNRPFSPQQIEENNSLRRELNLTQATTFPADNQLIAGQQFNAPHQVSVEQEVAEQLGIGLGDEISMQLPEGRLTAKVVSIRTVSWDSFSPNFFFIYSPNTFDEFAGSYLGSFYVPDAERHQLASLVADFPTTMFIDIDAILAEVRNLLTTLGQALGLLAMLVSLAGLLVLLASLQLLVDQRYREVVLLRVIGLSRGQLRQRLAIEMAIIGFMAGLLAVLMAEGVAALLAWRLEIPVGPHYIAWLVLPIGMLLLAAGIGQWRLQPLWKLSPLLILRRNS